jgi:hypothetical protein
MKAYAILDLMVRKAESGLQRYLGEDEVAPAEIADVEELAFRNIPELIPNDSEAAYSSRLASVPQGFVLSKHAVINYPDAQAA